MGHLHQYGTEFLIVDDAHDLSLEHLMLLKEVTDQGWLQYDHPLGLCLVAAGRGDTIPLKETFDLPDPTWLQFRRRFDKLAPFCRIASHTSEEVRAILATLETVYQQLFPQLNFMLHSLQPAPGGVNFILAQLYGSSNFLVKRWEKLFFLLSSRPSILGVV